MHRDQFTTADIAASFISIWNNDGSEAIRGYKRTSLTGLCVRNEKQKNLSQKVKKKIKWGGCERRIFKLRARADTESENKNFKLGEQKY